jgi:hypothetical protein
VDIKWNKRTYIDIVCSLGLNFLLCPGLPE